MKIEKVFLSNYITRISSINFDFKNDVCRAEIVEPLLDTIYYVSNAKWYIFYTAGDSSSISCRINVWYNGNRYLRGTEIYRIVVL